MRIQFLSDQVYDTGAPGRGPRFAEGQVVDIAEVEGILGQPVTPDFARGFLQRWLNRGVAVIAPVDAPDAGDGTLERDYVSLTRAELDALAAERGIDISDAKNKGDVIAALQLADEA